MACMSGVLANIGKSYLYTCNKTQVKFVAWTLWKVHWDINVRLCPWFRFDLGRPFGVSLMTLLLRLLKVVAPPAASFAAASVVVAGVSASSPSRLSTPSASPSTPVTGNSQLFFQLRQSISICEVGCPVGSTFAFGSIWKTWRGLTNVQPAWRHQFRNRLVRVGMWKSL